MYILTQVGQYVECVMEEKDTRIKHNFSIEPKRRINLKSFDSLSNHKFFACLHALHTKHLCSECSESVTMSIIVLTPQSIESRMDWTAVHEQCFLCHRRHNVIQRIATSISNTRNKKKKISEIE